MGTPDAYECMVYCWKAHATQNLISTKPQDTVPKASK